MKCRTGFKSKNGKCTKTLPKKFLGGAYDEYSLVKLALIASITSVGGWAVFTGITKIFKLDGLGGLWMILVGIIIILITYKLGFTKKK